MRLLNHYKWLDSRSGCAACLAMALSVVSPVSRAHAAVLPYTDNFNSYTVGTTGAASTPTNFNETTDGSWGIASQGAGDNAYQFSATGSASTSFSLTRTNNTGFIFTSNVKPTSFATTTNYSLGFLATSAGSGSTTFDTGYRVTLQPDNTNTVGTLSIFDGSTNAASGGTTISFAKNSTYDLKALVTYAGAIPTIKFTVTDEGNNANTASVSYTDNSSPATGSFFGYRVGAANGGTGTAQFDDLSITTVPEASCIAMLGFSCLGLLRRQRQI